MQPRKSLVHAVAVECLSRGISVFPWGRHQRGQRMPLRRWSQFVEKPMDPKKWPVFAEGLAIITGRPSGGLCALDFDDMSVYRQVVEKLQKQGLGDLVQRIEDGCHELSPRGVHWLFWLPDEACSDAVRTPKDVEFKGDGGNITIAPTGGNVRPDGGLYTSNSRPWHATRLTDTEWRELVAVLEAMAPPEPEREPEREKRDVDPTNLLPGQHFDQVMEWGQILEPHGWARVRGKKDWWRKPGANEGHHASTDKGVLIVFTPKTEFEPNVAYTKFGAYAELEHQGDMRAAAIALREQGFGSDGLDGVDVSGIVSAVEGGGDDSDANQAETIPPPPTAESTLPPLFGNVQRLADSILASCWRPMPELAAGAALAACAGVLGRRVADPFGVFPHLYCIGVAPSASGKDSHRTAVKAIFEHIGAHKMIQMEKVASGSAVEMVIWDSPSTLALIDEFGVFLEGVIDRRADRHVREIAEMMLNLYSIKEHSSITLKRKASEKERDGGGLRIIQAPTLSIFGLTTVKRVYRAMTPETIEDGLFSRCLFFESNEHAPINRRQGPRLPPQDILDAFAHWHHEGGDMRDDPTFVPDLRRIPYSRKAHDRIAELEAALDAERAPMHNTRSLEYSALGRLDHSARRIALIYACMEDPEAPVVSPEMVEAAWALADHLVRRALRSALMHGAGDDFERLANEIVVWLIEQGREVTHTALAKRFQKKDFDAALRAVLAGGRVKMRTAKGAQKARYYRAT